MFHFLFVLYVRLFSSHFDGREKLCTQHFRGANCQNGNAGQLHCRKMDAKYDAIIALYLEGKSNSVILRKLSHLQLNRLLVYRTIKRFVETGSVQKRHGGGKKPTATCRANIECVRKSSLTGRQIAKQLNISPSSVYRMTTQRM